MTSPGGITTDKRYEHNDGTAKGWWRDAADPGRAGITRSSKRGSPLAATNLLAGEVLPLLAAQGIIATERPAMTDPEHPYLVTTEEDGRGTDRVMSISIQADGRELILPLCPATPILRLYALMPTGETNAYDEPALTEEIQVQVKADADGWTTAQAIADAITAAIT